MLDLSDGLSVEVGSVDLLPWEREMTGIVAYLNMAHTASRSGLTIQLEARQLAHVCAWSVGAIGQGCATENDLLGRLIMFARSTGVPGIKEEDLIAIGTQAKASMFNLIWRDSDLRNAIERHERDYHERKRQSAGAMGLN